MAQVDVILEGKVLFTYPVHLGMMNGPQPGEAEYIAQAKRAALDDGLLKADQADKAEFRVRP